jgi:hypothetical protein
MRDWRDQGISPMGPMNTTQHRTFDAVEQHLMQVAGAVSSGKPIPGRSVAATRVAQSLGIDPRDPRMSPEVIARLQANPAAMKAVVSAGVPKEPEVPLGLHGAARRDPKEMYVATSGNPEVDARAKELLGNFLTNMRRSRPAGEKSSDLEKSIKAGRGPLDPASDSQRKRNWGTIEQRLFDEARKSLAGEEVSENYRAPIPEEAALEAAWKENDTAAGLDRAPDTMAGGGTPPPVEPPVTVAGPAPEEDPRPVLHAVDNATVVAQREEAGLAGAGIKGDKRKRKAPDAYIADSGGGEGGGAIHVIVDNFKDLAGIELKVAGGGGGGRSGGGGGATAAERVPENEEAAGEDEGVEAAEEAAEEPAIKTGAKDGSIKWADQSRGRRGMAVRRKNLRAKDVGTAVKGDQVYTYEPDTYAYGVSTEEGILGHDDVVTEAKRLRDRERFFSSRMTVDERKADAERVAKDKRIEAAATQAAEAMYYNTPGSVAGTGKEPTTVFQGPPRPLRPISRFVPMPGGTPMEAGPPTPAEIRAQREAERARTLAQTMAASRAYGEAHPAPERPAAAVADAAAGNEWVRFKGKWEVQQRNLAQFQTMLGTGASMKEIVAGAGNLIRKRRDTIDEPAPLSFEGKAAVNFGRVQAAHEARMRNEYEMDPALARVRLGRVGFQSMMTERTPRGTAAVLGAISPFGGGISFKERQELSRQSQMKYGRISTETEARLERFQAADATLKRARLNGATDEDMASFQKRRTEAFTELKDIVGKRKKARDTMLENEKFAAPKPLDIARSFGSIIASTTAYGVAMSAVAMLIQKAALPALEAMGDSLMSWQVTATRVTSGLAEQTTAAHGNVEAVMAQTAATAGLSKEMMNFISSAVVSSVVAKSAQAAVATEGGLVRAASYNMQGSGAPQGLYGGYGGILGSAVLASEMGGNKGFAETVGATFEELGKSLDAARKYRPVIGKPGSMGVQYGPADTERIAGAEDLLANYGKDLEAAFQREAEATYRVGGAFKVKAGATQQEKEDFKRAADMTGDPAASAAAQQMIDQGYVFTDALGNIAKSAKEIDAQWAALAKGKTIADVGTWASGFRRQMEGQMQSLAIQAERAMTLSIPWSMAQQTLQNPLIQPGIGFFGTNNQGQIGASQIARAGVTGNAANLTGQWLGQASQMQQQVQAISKQGFLAQVADIQQNNPGIAGFKDVIDFTSLYVQANNASKSIADTTTALSKLQQQASQKNWDNQIRLASRALGDALGMQGKIASADGKIHATRLGRLEREQYLNQRASSRLGLQLQQREITTQLALAQFQAPGETGEERYFRQKEAIVKAGIGQQQLDFSWKDFRISGEIWKENVDRAAKDARKSLEIMQLTRDAEGASVAAQAKIAEAQKLLGITVGKMDAIVSKSGGSFNAALSAATSGVSDFSGSVKTAVKEIYASVGLKYDSKTGKVSGSGLPYAGSAQPTSPKPAGDWEWDANKGQWVKAATGYLGQVGSSGAYMGGFAKGAMFTVGEAGPETVAILRNPRAAKLGGDGGAGPTNVTVNINGASVRSDDDISSLARRVAMEVERSLARKGQMFGLRGPSV